MREAARGEIQSKMRTRFITRKMGTSISSPYHSTLENRSQIQSNKKLLPGEKLRPLLLDLFQSFGRPGFGCCLGYFIDCSFLASVRTIRAVLGHIYSRVQSGLPSEPKSSSSLFGWWLSLIP